MLKFVFVTLKLFDMAIIYCLQSTFIIYIANYWCWTSLIYALTAELKGCLLFICFLMIVLQQHLLNLVLHKLDVNLNTDTHIFLNTIFIRISLVILSFVIPWIWTTVREWWVNTIAAKLLNGVGGHRLSQQEIWNIKNVL